MVLGRFSSFFTLVSTVELKYVYKDIDLLDPPIKIKETVNFLKFLCMIFLMKVFSLQGFLTFSKMQRLNQFLRKSLELIKKITGLLAFSL